jgi:hypothetical protein
MMTTVSGVLATRTITGATKADPCVISSTAHGFVAGDRVYIAGIVGMTELNGRWFTVGTVNANDFQLSGEDSTGHTTYSSAGTALKELSAELHVKKGDRFTLAITGTFVALLQLEFSDNGGAAWQKVKDLRDGLASQTYVSERSGRYRVRMTSWTSGAATYSLADAAAIIGEETDDNGQVILRKVEGGIELPGTLEVTGQATLGTVEATSAKLKDSDASHLITLVPGNESANRNLSIPVLGGNQVLVTEGNTQTLTNKTLTAPALTDATGSLNGVSGSLASPTITTPTIVGAQTLPNGVQILTVAGAPDDSVQASLVIDSGAADSDLTFTAVVGGTAPESISVEVVQGVGISDPLAVDVVGNAITITLPSDGDGDPVAATATEVKDAYDLVSAATDLATVAKEGTGNGAVDVTAAANLDNGVDGTGQGTAGTGSLAIDYTTPGIYQNTGTADIPAWTENGV